MNLSVGHFDDEQAVTNSKTAIIFFIYTRILKMNVISRHTATYSKAGSQISARAVEVTSYTHNLDILNKFF